MNRKYFAAGAALMMVLTCFVIIESESTNADPPYDITVTSSVLVKPVSSTGTVVAEGGYYTIQFVMKVGYGYPTADQITAFSIGPTSHTDDLDDWYDAAKGELKIPEASLDANITMTITATATESQVRCSAFDTEEKMVVIGYDDKALLVDINNMPGLGDDIEYVVGLEPSGGTELLIGPVSALNGRFWIDAAGNDASGNALLSTEYATTVNLYAYGHTETELGSAAITFSASDVGVRLYQNYLGSDVNNGNTTDLGGNMSRKVKYDITDDEDTGLQTAPVNYSIKGYSTTSLAGSKIHMDADSEATVEGIITQMYLNGVATPISGGYITLFAIWQKTAYRMLVADVSDVAGTADSAAYGNHDVAIEINGTQYAKANLTEIVNADDFGLLRIEQTTAGSSYRYTLGNFQKITAISDAGVITWGDAEADTALEQNDYTFTLLANGLYKIVPHTDIRFTIQMAAASDDVTTGYSFTVDRVTNTDIGGGSPTANVKLSLDLYDYDIHIHQDGVNDHFNGAQTISLNGTYFKTLGTSNSAVRVYGNIVNLTIADEEAYTPGDPNAWTARYDNALLTEEQVDDDELLKNGALQLNEDTQMYDLILDLSGCNIYAVQGQWDAAAVEASADPVVDAVPAKQMTTPWALYEA